MTQRKDRFRDALGAAESYLRALELMACATFDGGGKDYCAYLAIIAAAKAEVNVAQVIIDVMEVD
ncbi:hypothetical protein [Rhizobium sp. AP16]|uniref:hypothetical protein n=1 Tax=Rhizobium sp. AP16 TaxID=1144306 RepID=UPI00026ED266|nr:hypothetical protein [Rhizobium sp. AP16]EJK83563.1 hypothetical protein PMI03_03218 [Rhizobium sp. AP16]